MTQILSDNHLQTPGVQAICATLQENTNITRLTLSGNGFDDATAIPLSEIILVGTFFVWPVVINL